MLLEALALDLKFKGLKDRTIQDYVRILSRSQPESYTRVAVATWIHEAPSQATRRHRYLAVNALCRMLVDEGELERNPCERIPMPQEKTKPQPVLTDATYNALLRSCDQTWLGKRDKALLTLLASTGCRRAELTGLQRDDIDVKAGQVIIRNGKGGKWRVAYLDDAAKKAMLSYLRVYRGKGALWTTAGGTALSANAVRLMLKRRGEMVGTQVSAHQFRRRMATNWLLAGGSQVGLMNAAGWCNPTMPARYTALAAQDIARAEFERMNRG